MKFKELVESISAHISLNAVEYETLLQFFVYKKVSKNEMLMQEGDVCRYGVFVLNGCISYYALDKNGDENVVDLGTKGWWMGDAASYWQEVPTAYNLKAIAESEVLLIDKKATERAFSDIPGYLRYHFFMLLAYRDRTDHLLQESLHERAENKYKVLLATRPEIFQLASLADIASFIGVTPQSLSRLRHNMH